MKIQMPKHEIWETTYANINDIPLAYINVDDTKLSANVQIEEDFLNETSVPVRAYDEIADSDVLFFNSNKEIIKDVQLKRHGNKHVYEPKDMTEFTPMTFECNVLIKKNMTFKSNENYNIKVSVIEDSVELTYSTNMIKLFGDAYRRGIAPPNITVNNQSLRPESLISSSLLNNDFVFAHSPDGINIVNEDSEVIQELKIEELLNEHINVWLSVDSFGDMLIERSADNKTITYNSPLLFNRNEYIQTADKIHIFNTLSTHKEYKEVDYIYDFLSEAVLVLEKRNCGYLIITPSFLLNDLESNACLIYEVLMNVFLKAYYLSATTSSWITNEPVDYMAYSNKKLNIYHKDINLTKLLSNNDYEIGGQYSLLSVNISNENVKFKNIAPNGNMFFYKTGTKDPVKKDGEISYLTTKQTIINYKQENIYFLETKLNIDTVIIDNSTAYITVHPYCSSSYKIHTTDDQTFVLTDKDIQYYVCVKPSSPEIENIFTFIPMDKYSYDNDGYILAYVTLTAQKDTKIYDIRIMGGGLPISEPNNYNLIDIGNVYGRPYRIGSTMIIRLPKICQQYNDIITSEVNKHIASGDYPIIIYE